MSTTLDVWLSSGSLQRHTTNQQEVAALLAIVERDLTESQTPGLSDFRDTVFNSLDLREPGFQGHSI